MSSFTIALNMSNVVSGSTNSLYRYNFPAGGAKLNSGFEVALQSLSMYYSWPNISVLNNNYQFTYLWLGGQVINVEIPTGFYTIAEINSYLQSVMVDNSHYLIDSNGDFVYFLEIITNQALYAVQLNCFPIPTEAEAIAAGYTHPSGWSGYPVGSAETAQFVIPDTNIQNIFGIYAGTYPTAVQSTVYSKASDFTPQVSPVSSVYVLVNLVNNRFGLPQNIIYNFSPSVSYGSQINVVPPTLVYSKIQIGQYDSISVQFVDQDFQPVNILDSNVSILLSIKEPVGHDPFI